MSDIPFPHRNRRPVVSALGLQRSPKVRVAPDVMAKKNPLPNDKKFEQGGKLAQVNCVTCHGAKGKGDGAAAVALNPKPADWTSKKVQDESDGELFWKISNGRGAMPPWKHLPKTTKGADPLYPLVTKRPDRGRARRGTVGVANPARCGGGNAEPMNDGGAPRPRESPGPRMSGALAAERDGRKPG
jgi:cytochrome c5